MATSVSRSPGRGARGVRSSPSGSVSCHSESGRSAIGGDYGRPRGVWRGSVSRCDDPAPDREIMAAPGVGAAPFTAATIPRQTRVRRRPVACAGVWPPPAVVAPAPPATWPPSWYPDPWEPGTVRWWDGQAWTEHTARPAVAAPGAVPHPARRGGVAGPGGHRGCAGRRPPRPRGPRALRLADRRLRAAGHHPRLRADGGVLLVGLPPVGHGQPGRRRRRPRALDRSRLGAGHLDLGVGGRHRGGDRRVRAPPADQVEHRRHRPLHRRPWRADRLPHRRRRRGAARRGAHVPGRRHAGIRLDRAGVAGRRRAGPVLRRRPRRPRPGLGEHRAARRARRGGVGVRRRRPTCCAGSGRP